MGDLLLGSGCHDHLDMGLPAVMSGASQPGCSHKGGFKGQWHRAEQVLRTLHKEDMEMYEEGQDDKCDCSSATMGQSEKAAHGQRQRRKASSIDDSSRSRLAAWRQLGHGNQISRKEETKDDDDDEGGHDSNRIDCWAPSSTSPQIDAAYPSTSPPAAAYHVFSTSPASLGSCSSSESAGPSRPPSAASSYSGRASRASSSAVRIQQASDFESGTPPREPSPQMVPNGHSRGPSSGSTVSRTRSIGRSHRSPRTDVDAVMSSGPSTPSRPWRARLYGLGVTVDELDSLASCHTRGNSLHHHHHRAVRDSESPVPPVPTWPYTRHMMGGNALPALSTSSLPIRYDQQHSPNIKHYPHESSYALGKGKGADRAPSYAQQQQYVSPGTSMLSPPQRSRRSRSVPLGNRSADVQCSADPTTGCENLHSKVAASPRRHSLHTDWIAPHAPPSRSTDKPAGAPVVTSDSCQVPDSNRLRRSRTSSPRIERHRKVTQGSVHILKYWIGSPSTEARGDVFGAKTSSDTGQFTEEPAALQAASDDEPVEELSLDHDEFTGATTPVSPSTSSPDLASHSPSVSSSRASISPSTSYRSFAKRSFTALVQAFASSSTSAKDRPPAPARSPSQISWMPMLGSRTEEQKQSSFASPERLESAISSDAIYSAKGHEFGNPGPAPNAPTGAGDGGSGGGGGSNDGGPPRRGDHHGRRHMGDGSGGSGGGGGGDRNPGRGPGGGHPRSGSEGSSSSVQSRFKKLELVGRGAYGAVYRGMRLQDNHIVAIKVVNLDTPDDDVSDIQKEIALLTQLRETEQKNIVRYFGCWLKGPELWIVMDYAEGGSVRTLMQAGPISEQYANLIVRETLVALAYLHKAGIIHRDIKAANILLTQQGRILICDFGVAASLVSSASKRTTFVGTPYWMAPEVITSGKSYDQSADIWSLGITVYEMVIGNPPLADQEQMRAIMLIPKNKPPRLPTDKNFSQPMRDFVSSCLNEEAKERPGAEELSKSKWIKSNAKTSTSVLRELIAAYNAWTKAGGMRMSLLGAQAADLDANGDPLSGDRSFDADGDWEFNTFRNETREHESEEKLAAPHLAAGHGGQRNLALMRLFHPEGESMDDSAFGAGVGSSVGHHEENPLVNINPVRPAPAPPPQQQQQQQQQQQHPDRPTPAVAPATETAETVSSQQVQAAAPTPAVEKPSFTGTGASPFRFGAPVSSNTAAQQPRAPPVAANNGPAAESGPSAATASATPVPPLATPTRRLASDADLAKRFRRGEGAGSHSSSSNEQNAPPLATTHSRNHSIASATSDRSGTYSSHHQPHGSISGQSALFGDFTRPWVTGRSRGSSNGSSTSDLDMPLPTRNNSLPLSSNGFASSASTSLTGVSPPNMAPPGSTSGWHPPQPSLLGPRTRSGSRSRAGPGSDLGMPQTIAPPLPQQLPAIPNASAAPRDQSGRTPYASPALPGNEGAHSEHFQPGMPGAPFHFGRARHGSTTTRPSPLGLGQVTGPSREAVPTLGSSHNRRQHGGSDPIVPSPKGFPPYEIAEPGSGPTNGVASASAAASAAAVVPHESARRASLVQDGSAGVPGSEEQAGRPIYPLDLSALRSKEEVHAQLERTVDDLSYWLDAVALSLAQQEV